MAFYDPKMLEVHVLLVDNDVSNLIEIGGLLHSNSYKVSAFQEASLALSQLSKGDQKFDVVMVDVNSADVERYKLVYDAVQMGLIVVLMSASANPMLVKCAIEDGAFLFIEKPASLDVIMYLWQHVLREKTRKRKEEKGKSKEEENILDNENHDHRSSKDGDSEKEKSGQDDVAKNIKFGPKDNVPLTDRVDDVHREFGSKDKAPVMNQGDDDGHELDCKVKYKIRNEWSRELHERFMDAVKVLGDGKCLPKEILKIMNVPGLTRVEVAIHLQKCRRGWQPPEERKTRRSRSSNSYLDNISKKKRYGTFPGLTLGSSHTQFSVQDQNKLCRREQALDANQKMEPSMSSTQTENMIDQGTFYSTNLPVSSDFNMHEISNLDRQAYLEDVTGYMPPSETFSISSEIDNNHEVPENNLNPQDYASNLQDGIDFDQDFSHKVVPRETNEDDAVFWNSWMESIARDFGSDSG